MQAKRKEFVATFLRLCQKKAKGIEWKQIIGGDTVIMNLKISFFLKLFAIVFKFFIKHS
jgi:hypothetical protein